jgi:hypothetical protein
MSSPPPLSLSLSSPVSLLLPLALFYPYPAPPLPLLLYSPASVLWVVSSLLNMDPLQLLLIRVLEI